MVKWLVKVGDKVKEGDTLAEIQTDKAVMPMESFDEGVVALLDVKEGDDIALGQRVLVLARKGEDPAAVAKQSAAARRPRPRRAPARTPTARIADQHADPARAWPTARRRPRPPRRARRRDRRPAAG